MKSLVIIFFIILNVFLFTFIYFFENKNFSLSEENKQIQEYCDLYIETEKKHQDLLKLNDINNFKLYTKDEIEKQFIDFYDEYKDIYNLDIKEFIKEVVINDKKYIFMTINGYVNRKDKEKIKNVLNLKYNNGVLRFENINGRLNNFEFEFSIYQSFKE